MAVRAEASGRGARAPVSTAAPPRDGACSRSPDVDASIRYVGHAEVERLRRVPPFDAVPGDRLLALLSDSRVLFFRRGSTLVHPEVVADGPRFWVLREGRVRGCEASSTLAFPGGDVHLEAGALFPPEAVLTPAVRSWRVYAAERDSYAWKIEGDEVARWRAEPAIAQWVATQLRDEQRRLREAVVDLVEARQHADQALAMPVRSIGVDNPVCVPADLSIADAAARMAEHGIGSLLVGAENSVVGIVTESDLIRRALALRLSHDAKVADVMTPDPTIMNDSVSVIEAGTAMANGRFRHLPLRDPKGRVAALISERDVFRALQHGITDVFKPVDNARSIDELADVARAIQLFSTRVFQQGMEVVQFSHLVSSLNDRITRRVLTLVGGDRFAGIPFCWLAFGSEAREEQGFVTDQDNGLVFAPPASGDVEEIRQRLLAFATDANDALQACGFPRCKGNIMAGNPQWCLSLPEWQSKFTSWIRTPAPEALLNATIFFDLRPMHGDRRLGESLLEHLLAESAGNTIFLHQLTSIALKVKPPLGRLSRFVTSDDAGTVDLKTQGTRLFVDVARTYALANGVRSANTIARLRIIGPRIRRSAASTEGDIAAFRLVQAARLRRQLASLADGGDPNRVDPYTLDELEQRILRESLRQAASLQERLQLDLGG